MKSYRFLPGESGDSARAYHTIVLGLGNIILSDEGLGVHVATALKARYSFPPGIEIIDGGTMGLDLLPFLQDADRALILDAVDFGKPPGHIGIVEGDAIPSVLNTKLSVHHIGLSDLLFAARLTRRTPLETCLIGMQPGSLEVGIGLTDAVRCRTDAMIENALRKLKEWDVTPFAARQDEDRPDPTPVPKPFPDPVRREASFFLRVIL